jgi:hypothetical protein
VADAQAVTDLIRIKTLSDAGVPLARIAELAAATGCSCRPRWPAISTSCARSGPASG